MSRAPRKTTRVYKPHTPLPVNLKQATRSLAARYKASFTEPDPITLTPDEAFVILRALRKAPNHG